MLPRRQTRLFLNIIRKTDLSYSRLRYFSQHAQVLRRTVSSITGSPNTDSAQEKSIQWTSNEIRRTFLNYFISRHGHEYVHSSSVIPPRDTVGGTYFTNAGMNQFRPIFLGTAESGSHLSKYKRVANSQKCIRVGGKHNDLNDVGKDLYHHTFFEMLGNWSFADYFKKDACSMAVELLTDVYGIPKDRLYVTYFGGDTSQGLPPDIETRDIWLQLGFPDVRVLPYGMKENFWEMGYTGPCGPCTEIHYDHCGNRDASRLVNAGSPDVIELWNLVFIQYDRQKDGSLTPLSRHYVDTGMGLERLCAVLQGTRSNYDTDLFTPLFEHISKFTRCRPYRGLVGPADCDGMDAAYRIVSDHARMFTVAIADGLLPGMRDLEHKLREIIHRCIGKATVTLHSPKGLASSLVPVVVDALGDAFPELCKNPSQVSDVISRTEELYLESRELSRHAMMRMLNKAGNIKTISGDCLLGLLEGHYGYPVPVDIVVETAAEKGLMVDMAMVDAYLQERRTVSLVNATARLKKQSDIGHELIKLLQDAGIASTDDNIKYSREFTPVADLFVSALVKNGRLVDSVSCDDTDVMIILDKTNFYSESGGQSADQGDLISESGTFNVCDVQAMHGYVFHIGSVSTGYVETGSRIAAHLNKKDRKACMCNHTSTHLLHHSLVSVIGQEVRQKGSWINAEKLTFDFTYMGHKDMLLEKVAKSESLVQRMIHQTMPVFTAELPQTDALKLPSVMSLQDEEYSSIVRVVSIGVSTEELTAQSAGEITPPVSVELCGGTHVENTSEIGDFCITKLASVSQNIKRITALSGSNAKQAQKNGIEAELYLSSLREILDEKRDTEFWEDSIKQMNALLTEDCFPRIQRERLQKEFDLVRLRMNENINRIVREGLKKSLIDVLKLHKESQFVVTEFRFQNQKDIAKIIIKHALEKPLVLVTSSGDKTIAIVHMPTTHPAVTTESVAKHLASFTGGDFKALRGKGLSNFMFVSADCPNSSNMLLASARQYLQQNLT